MLSACGDEPQDATASQPTPPAASKEAGAEQTALDVGLAALSAGSALDRIATLASDAFGGRQPGTQGEQLTLDYLVEEFRGMGLAPGNPDGSYLQKVPLVGITADPSMQLTLSRDGTQLTPDYGNDYVAWTSRVTDTVSVDAELVFAGYGVQAPEFDWDDFRDVDVRDKVIVVLINDPPLADEDMFGGTTMTYYGRAGRSRVRSGGAGSGRAQVCRTAARLPPGTAGVLEVAQGFAAMPEAPARSLLFIAVTAEEQGLLGSRHYGENPLYPLSDTLAVINLDGMNVLEPTTDLVIVGLGNSTLDDVAEAVAAETGRTLKPDPEPEKGYFYRSDHFSLAKFGVPALFPSAGVEFIGRPEGWGVEMRERYTAEDYHKPTDTVRDNWNLEGLVEDAGFFLRLGYRVANDPDKSEWKPGTEFRAIRQASLRE